MKKGFLFLLLLWGAGSALFAQSENFRDPGQLKMLLQSDRKNYLFLDVRTAGEYAAGHIPGSVNISYERLPAALPKDTPKDMTIIVYCRSGNRSGQAARALKKAGYSNVHDFGAISRWPGDLVR